MKYYLITDIGTQWFTYIVSARELPPSKTRIRRCNITSFLKLDLGMHSNFINNIQSREPNFMLAEFLGWIESGDYYGWALSEKEFDTIKEMIYIYPTVEKFNKLSK